MSRSRIQIDWLVAAPDLKIKQRIEEEAVKLAKEVDSDYVVLFTDATPTTGRQYRSGEKSRHWSVPSYFTSELRLRRNDQKWVRAWIYPNTKEEDDDAMDQWLKSEHVKLRERFEADVDIQHHQGCRHGPTRFSSVFAAG